MIKQLKEAAARFLEGLRQGARVGARANTRMLDLATGRMLFHNHSHADDAARQVEQRRPR